VLGEDDHGDHDDDDQGDHDDDQGNHQHGHEG
jgi:hypothetical protein